MRNELSLSKKIARVILVIIAFSKAKLYPLERLLEKGLPVNNDG